MSENGFLKDLRDLLEEHWEKIDNGILSKIKALGIRGVKIFAKAFLLILLIGAGLMGFALAFLFFISPQAKSMIEFLAITFVCAGLARFMRQQGADEEYIKAYARGV